MKLSVVIPCLNEARTITRAISRAHTTARRLLADSDYEIVVADNGSTDGSLAKIKKQGLARIVTVPVKGYGAALHWGIHHAKGQYVIFADADLSYDFKQISRFVPYIHKVDLILGSRFLGEIKIGAMPWLHRYLGTPVLTWLIKTIYHLPVTDSNSGMRMIKKSFYKKLSIRNAGMEWASEVLIKTAINHGRYAEVPITLSPDQRSRPPHLLSWIDGWRHLKAIILLKPNSLLVIVMGLLVMAIWANSFSFSLVFLLVLAAFGLLLSLVAAKLLQQAIDQTPSMSVTVLEQIPVVGLTLISNVLVFIGVLLLSEKFMGLKLIGAGAVVVLDVWVFHIETIKTHLMNRLPDRLR